MFEHFRYYTDANGTAIVEPADSELQRNQSNRRITSVVLSFIALSILGFPATSSVQSPDTISFTAKVEQVSAILDRLGPEIGQQLQAGSEGDKHYLYIDVEDVAPPALLNAIAEATKSRWEEAGEILYLVPDSVLRRREALAERNAILEDLQSQIAALINTSIPESTVPEVRDRIERSIAVAEIARAADLTAIAALGPGERLVFAENPNSYQRAFRSNVSRQKSRIIAGINSDRSEREVAMGDEMLMFREMMALLGTDMEDLGFYTAQIDANQAKLVLIATHMDRGNRQAAQANASQSFTIEVAFLGQGGRILGTASAGVGARAPRTRPAPGDEVVRLDDSVIYDPSFTVDRPVPVAETASVENAQIEYPEAIRYLTERTGFGFSADNALPTRPELEEILLNPEEHDPLAMICVPLLEKVGPTLGENIVIGVTDDLLVRSDFRLTNIPRNVEQGAGWLAATTEIRDEGEIVVGVPKNIEKAVNARMNRPALGAFLRANHGALVVGLDSLAELAQHFDNADRDAWIGATTNVLTPLHDSWIGGGSLKGARLYGLMSSSTRARIRRGENVPFMELGSATIRAIESMVLKGDLSLTTRPHPIDQNLPEADRRAISQFRSLMSDDTEFASGNYERTELLGSTSPQTAFLASDVYHGPCLVPVAEDGKKVRSQPILSDFELGLLATAMERFADDAGLMSELEELRTVKVGERDMIVMQLVFNPVTVSTAVVYDDRVSAGAPRESIETWIARYPEVVAAVRRVMDRAGFLEVGGPEYRTTPP